MYLAILCRPLFTVIQCNTTIETFLEKIVQKAFTSSAAKREIVKNILRRKLLILSNFVCFMIYDLPLICHCLLHEKSEYVLALLFPNVSFFFYGFKLVCKDYKIFASFNIFSCLTSN